MNHFVWADLSTYDPQASIPFYENVFGWEFQEFEGYFVAMKDGHAAAGLFETPEFFKQINMPHFWMSYIAVEDARAIVRLVEPFPSAKVELVDRFYGGNIALIRDPQGAGFTVYDGGQLEARSQALGRLVWNELHVSDSSTVLPFYEKLLGWDFGKSPSSSTRLAFGPDGTHVCDIREMTNEIKGKYEYWACVFNVENLESTRQAILEFGGGVITEDGQKLMVHDNSGEAFFYIQESA